MSRQGRASVAEGTSVLARTARTTRQARALEGGGLGAFTIVLFGTFVALDIVALLLGAMGYRAVHSAQRQSQTVSRTLGPLVGAVRANDADGSIAVGEGPEGRALVIVEALDSGTYETRLYLHEGYLVEEYSLAGSAYAPSKATRIAPSSSFDFSYSSGLLTVSTDGVSTEIALRSARGGGDS